MIRIRLWKTAASTVLLFSMLIGTAVPVLAAEAEAVEAVPQEKIHTAQELGPVSIGEDSYATVKDVFLMNGPEGRQASFTVTFHNNGKSDLSFKDYWVKLGTASGSTYPVKLLPRDQEKRKIPSGASATYTFYAKVSDTTLREELEFAIFRWDYSREDMENILGKLSIPDAIYTTITPEGSKRDVEAADVQLRNRVSRAVYTSNGKYTHLTVYYEMENRGSRQVEVPEFTYYFCSEDGSLYPMERTKERDKLTVSSKDSKEIQLKASIPVEIDPLKGKLLVVYSSGGFEAGGTQAAGKTTQNAAVPIAEHALPDSAGDEVEKESIIEFTTKAGPYQAKLDDLQRWPSEEQDLLAAYMTVTNAGDEPLPLPGVSAYFLLGEEAKIAAKVIQLDESGTLQAKSSVRYQIIGSIPYKDNMADVKVVLQEKEDEETFHDIAELKYRGQPAAMPVIREGNFHETNFTGRNRAYAVQEVRTYKGETSDLLVTQLILHNREDRAVSPVMLRGFYSVPGGQVFPTEISTAQTKIGPEGRTLITIRGHIPPSTSITATKLILGEAVTDTKRSGPEDQPDGYIAPASFKLPNEQVVDMSNLKDIAMYPYSMSFSRIATQINFATGEVQVAFDSEIVKTDDVLSSMADHHVIIEIRDSKSNITYSQEYPIEELGSNEKSTGQLQLRLGKHKNTFSRIDKEFVFDIQFNDRYELNIYDEFQGHKKVLASKRLPWLMVSD